MPVQRESLLRTFMIKLIHMIHEAELRPAVLFLAVAFTLIALPLLRDAHDSIRGWHQARGLLADVTSPDLPFLNAGGMPTTQEAQSDVDYCFQQMKWNGASGVLVSILAVVCWVMWSFSFRLNWKNDQDCPKCGYDLTGNTSGVCPECGKVIPGR